MNEKVKAKIIDWRLEVVGQDHKDVVKVLFEDEKNFKYTWTGWLDSSESVQKAIKSLVLMGFVGNDLASLGSGTAGGALEAGKELAITLQTKTNPNGKNFTSVKFIDPIEALDSPTSKEKVFDKQAQSERLRRFKADVMEASKSVSTAKDAVAKPAPAMAHGHDDDLDL